MEPRSPRPRFEDAFCSLTGSFIPFARTKQERLALRATHACPSKSVTPNTQSYVAAVAQGGGAACRGPGPALAPGRQPFLVAEAERRRITPGPLDVGCHHGEKMSDGLRRAAEAGAAVSLRAPRTATPRTRAWAGRKVTRRPTGAGFCGKSRGNDAQPKPQTSSGSQSANDVQALSQTS